MLNSNYHFEMLKRNISVVFSNIFLNPLTRIWQRRINLSTFSSWNVKFKLWRIRKSKSGRTIDIDLPQIRVCRKSGFAANPGLPHFCEFAANPDLRQTGICGKTVFFANFDRFAAFFKKNDRFAACFQKMIVLPQLFEKLSICRICRGFLGEMRQNDHFLKKCGKSIIF